MVKVCGNGSSNIYSPVRDSGNSEEFMDSTDTILAGTIIESEFQTKGDCEGKKMELEEQLSSLNQQIEELQSTNDLYWGQIDSLSQDLKEKWMSLESN